MLKLWTEKAELRERNFRQLFAPSSFDLFLQGRHARQLELISLILAENMAHSVAVVVRARPGNHSLEGPFPSSRWDMRQLTSAKAPAGSI